MANNRPLSGRTLLISPSVPGELATELERQGARVLTWPKLDVGHLDNYAALDEAIENIFGYQWLIIRNVHAVDFFLKRFQALGHEVGELDSLRVCAIDDETTGRLREWCVHVDLVAAGCKPGELLASLETYVGGKGSLSRLNLLFPRAVWSRENLSNMLEGAGARVDAVASYRTAQDGARDLGHISALVTGGGVDCAIFTSNNDLKDLAGLFDTNDLSQVLEGVLVLCFGDISTTFAEEFGLRPQVAVKEFTLRELVRTIECHISES